MYTLSYHIIAEVKEVEVIHSTTFCLSPSKVDSSIPVNAGQSEECTRRRSVPSHSWRGPESCTRLLYQCVIYSINTTVSTLREVEGVDLISPPTTASEPVILDKTSSILRGGGRNPMSTYHQDISIHNN